MKTLTSLLIALMISAAGFAQQKTVPCKAIIKGQYCKTPTAKANGYCPKHQPKGITKPAAKTTKPAAKSPTLPIRCKVIAKGKKCTKTTLSPNGKCWQHGGN